MEQSINRLKPSDIQFCTPSLEKREGVVDVKIKECKSGTETQLRMWEKMHRPLPKDLRDFYLTSDGMLLCWSVNFGG